GGEVDGGGGLALGRRRAGDEDRRRVGHASAAGGRQRRAQRPVGLERGRRQALGGQCALGAAARLLRDATQDRKPVEGAKLLLAPQARIEDLERERAAYAQDQPGDDPRDDAELRL